MELWLREVGGRGVLGICCEQHGGSLVVPDVWCDFVHCARIPSPGERIEASSSSSSPGGSPTDAGRKTAQAAQAAVQSLQTSFDELRKDIRGGEDALNLRLTKMESVMDEILRKLGENHVNVEYC